MGGRMHIHVNPNRAVEEVSEALLLLHGHTADQVEISAHCFAIRGALRVSSYLVELPTRISANSWHLAVLPHYSNWPGICLRSVQDPLAPL